MVGTLYVMFKKLLPLAYSLSSTHTKVASNVLREFSIQKKKKRRYHLVRLPIIVTDLDTYSTMACTGKPRLVHHS